MKYTTFQTKVWQGLKALLPQILGKKFWHSLILLSLANSCYEHSSSENEMFVKCPNHSETKSQNGHHTCSIKKDIINWSYSLEEKRNNNTNMVNINFEKTNIQNTFKMHQSQLEFRLPKKKGRPKYVCVVFAHLLVQDFFQGLCWPIWTLGVWRKFMLKFYPSHLGLNWFL